MIIGSQPDMVLVSQATDASEALAQFRQHRPDITLMDLRLPRVDGTAVLIAIRKDFPEALRASDLPAAARAPCPRCRNPSPPWQT